jgi:hypothetical protein
VRFRDRANKCVLEHIGKHIKDPRAKYTMAPH